MIEFCLQYNMLLSIIILLIVSSAGLCRKDNMYWSLFRQGKSFLSRSFRFPLVNVPRVPNFIAQRDGHYYGLELFDNSVRNAEDHHHPDQDEELYQSNQNDPPAPPSDKEKPDFKIISYTDIIENDNMELYQFIGGISFASLLAATILILGRNRRNNTSTKSFEEISRSSGLHHDGYNTFLSGEKIVVPLSSQQYKLSLRKLSRRNQRPK